ncbi:hypothetical protein MRS44_011603 [Fusarium solani]|uniref:uncharacterized protein n=1 Tax=Fusarium solani TaxID=169388 RepID=UPI0032C3F33B|nr:hypothetical protein MRS44_011603 [Fusarium solani]
MAAIKKVAAIGALVDHGLEVTALTCPSSPSVLLADVEVKKVDFDSQESITEALRGQDAVVWNVGTLVVPAQLILIDAAVRTSSASSRLDSELMLGWCLVGKAIVAMLSTVEEMKNQYLAISSFTTSQIQLLKILEQQTGEVWAQGHVSTSTLEKIGREKLGQKNSRGVLDLMKAF